MHVNEWSENPEKIQSDLTIRGSLYDMVRGKMISKLRLLRLKPNYMYFPF